MHRSFIALVAAMVATTAVAAVTALAGQPAAPSFELTFEGWMGEREGGAEFTASGTFCPSGRVEALSYDVQLLRCADGSGTATALVAWEPWTADDGTWRIVSGTGAYEKLRGQGTLAIAETGDRDVVCDEWLGCEEVPALSTSWTGVADLDDVAPALRIVSAQASRLERPAGAYSLELALDIRDNIEGRPVPYVLRVTSGLRTLAWIPGTAEAESVALTVPIRPGKRALSVRVHVAASDALGNESSVKSPMVVLPR
jgi:hypothetical protein